jgi:hypothetical protein
LPQQRGGVTLRIERDEDDLKLVTVSPELLLCRREVRQGRRTHIRALREAEEHRDDLAAKIGERPLPA